MNRRLSSTELLVLALVGAIGGGAFGYKVMAENPVWGAFPMTCVAALLCGGGGLLVLTFFGAMMGPAPTPKARKRSVFETNDNPWSPENDFFLSQCAMAGLNQNETKEFARYFAGGSDDSWMHFVYDEAKTWKYGADWKKKSRK